MTELPNGVKTVLRGYLKNTARPDRKQFRDAFTAGALDGLEGANPRWRLDAPSLWRVAYAMGESITMQDIGG